MLQSDLDGFFSNPLWMSWLQGVGEQETQMQE